MPDDREWQDYRLSVIAEARVLLHDLSWAYPLWQRDRCEAIAEALLEVLLRDLGETEKLLRVLRDAQRKTMGARAD